MRRERTGRRSAKGGCEDGLWRPTRDHNEDNEKHRLAAPSIGPEYCGGDHDYLRRGAALGARARSCAPPGNSRPPDPPNSGHDRPQGCRDLSRESTIYSGLTRGTGCNMPINLAPCWSWACRVNGAEGPDHGGWLGP